MRLGLANLPLLAALGEPREKPLFSLKDYCLLVLLKIFGQAVVTGSLFSYVFLFSLCGSASSAAIMYVLRAARLTSLAGTSLAGAFVFNTAQIVLARFFIFGPAAAALAPPLLAAGIISGAVLGIFAENFMERSRWIRNLREARTEGAALAGGKARASSGGIRGAAVLVGTAAAAAPFFFAPLWAKAGLLVFFTAAAAVSGKKIRPVAALAFMAGIVVCNFFPPFGKILVQAGPLTVTQESLYAGIAKAVQFEGLLMLSKLAVPYLSLPGSFGVLFGETFRILRRLEERKNIMFSGPKNSSLDERLDKILLELDLPDSTNLPDCSA